MTNQKFKKIYSRFYPIIVNGLRSVLQPLFSIGFSYIVVNYFSKTLWGNFVEYILFFLIASVIFGWGDRSYLLRTFSETPKQIYTNWQSLFISRLPIIGVFIGAIVILYPFSQFFILVLWLFGLYLYNSFLPIVYYDRDYIKSILIETLGFSTLIFQLYLLRNTLNLELLIRSYAISIVIKAMMMVLSYNSYLKIKDFKINFSILKLSFPFFILGVTGFLQTKIDIYVYSLFHKGKLLGEYQIISGLLIFAISLVTLLSFPYVKNIYRLRPKSIIKFKQLMTTYGLILNIASIGTIYLILLYGFNIRLSYLQICLAYFISYPSYVYTAHIYNLIKQKKENTVIRISAYSLLINLLLSVLLLSLGYNFTGVLLASAIAQLFCMIYSLKFKING